MSVVAIFQIEEIPFGGPILITKEKNPPSLNCSGLIKPPKKHFSQLSSLLLYLLHLHPWLRLGKAHSCGIGRTLSASASLRGGSCKWALSRYSPHELGKIAFTAVICIQYMLEQQRI